MDGLVGSETFMNSLGSGVGANLITVGAIALIICIRSCSKKHYKHSKCSAFCCNLELDEESKTESDIENQKEIKHKDKEDDAKRPTI